MYLLYLDESGSPADPHQRFFVMAGICVFERQTHWVDQHMELIAKRFNPTTPDKIELHAAPMRSGADGWKSFPANNRSQAVVDALHLLSNQQLRIKVLGAVIEKAQMPVGTDMVKAAFEAIAVEFDSYLASRFRNKKEQARGLVILDKADYERHIQSLSHTFKHVGHASGKLRNFAEVPLFIDSKASRMIQLADLVAYWIFRRYEAGDHRGFAHIGPAILRYQGEMNGLKEFVSTATSAELTNPRPQSHPFPPPSPL
jgi:hypothetical protein